MSSSTGTHQPADSAEAAPQPSSSSSSSSAARSPPPPQATAENLLPSSSTQVLLNPITGQEERWPHRSSAMTPLGPSHISLPDDSPGTPAGDSPSAAQSIAGRESNRLFSPGASLAATAARNAARHQEEVAFQQQRRQALLAESAEARDARKSLAIAEAGRRAPPQPQPTPTAPKRDLTRKHSATGVTAATTTDSSSSAPAPTPPSSASAVVPSQLPTDGAVSGPPTNRSGLLSKTQSGGAPLQPKNYEASLAQQRRQGQGGPQARVEVPTAVTLRLKLRENTGLAYEDEVTAAVIDKGKGKEADLGKGKARELAHPSFGQDRIEGKFADTPKSRHMPSVSGSKSAVGKHPATGSSNKADHVSPSQGSGAHTGIYPAISSPATPITSVPGAEADNRRDKGQGDALNSLPGEGVASQPVTEQKEGQASLGTNPDYGVLTMPSSAVPLAPVEATPQANRYNGHPGTSERDASLPGAIASREEGIIQNAIAKSTPEPTMPVAGLPGQTGGSPASAEGVREPQQQASASSSYSNPAPALDIIPIPANPKHPEQVAKTNEKVLGTHSLGLPLIPEDLIREDHWDETREKELSPWQDASSIAVFREVLREKPQALPRYLAELGPLQEGEDELDARNISLALSMATGVGGLVFKRLLRGQWLHEEKGAIFNDDGVCLRLPRHRRTVQEACHLIEAYESIRADWLPIVKRFQTTRLQLVIASLQKNPTRSPLLGLRPPKNAQEPTNGTPPPAAAQAGQFELARDQQQRMTTSTRMNDLIPGHQPLTSGSGAAILGETMLASLSSTSGSAAMTFQQQMSPLQPVAGNQDESAETPLPAGMSQSHSSESISSSQMLAAGRASREGTPTDSTSPPPQPLFSSMERREGLMATSPLAAKAQTQSLQGIVENVFGGSARESVGQTGKAGPSGQTKFSQPPSNPSTSEKDHAVELHGATGSDIPVDQPANQVDSLATQANTPEHMGSTAAGAASQIAVPPQPLRRSFTHLTAAAGPATPGMPESVTRHVLSGDIGAEYLHAARFMAAGGGTPRAGQYGVGGSGTGGNSGMRRGSGTLRGMYGGANASPRLGGSPKRMRQFTANSSTPSRPTKRTKLRASTALTEVNGIVVPQDEEGSAEWEDEAPEQMEVDDELPRGSEGDSGEVGGLGEGGGVEGAGGARGAGGSSSSAGALDVQMHAPQGEIQPSSTNQFQFPNPPVPEQSEVLDENEIEGTAGIRRRSGDNRRTSIALSTFSFRTRQESGESYLRPRNRLKSLLGKRFAKPGSSPRK